MNSDELNLRNAILTSDQGREQAIALLDLVSTTSSISSVQEQLLVSNQHKLLTSLLAQLRGQHRSAIAGSHHTKWETAEARQEVDKLQLGLHNLAYEERHLQNEIAACEAYDHKYLQLPLISVNNFLMLHPECADLGEDALTIARIEHEHTEREALEQQRQGLLKKKQGLIADNKKRKDDLANLDKQLENFIDAAKPIQKTLEKVV